MTTEAPEWASRLQSRIQAGEPLPVETTLWLLRMVLWQNKQLTHARDAIVGTSVCHAIGPTGEEGWYEGPDAEAVMNTDPPHDFQKGPPHWVTCSRTTNGLPTHKELEA